MVIQEPPSEQSFSATSATAKTAEDMRKDFRRIATRAHRQAADRILFFILLDLALLAGYLTTGSIRPVEIAIFAIAGLLDIAAYRYGIVRGWHLRGSGIALTAGMTGLVSAHLLGFAFYAPQVGVMMLITLITVIAMTALMLPFRYMVVLCIVLGLGSLALMNIQHAALTLPMSTWVEQALSAFWFTMLLGRGALLNLKGQELRILLARKNTALTKAIERLEYLATRDELTGVLNRRAAMQILSDEIARSKRTGRPFSVAMLDIDKFKLINDHLGHGAGDQVLQHFASVLKAAVRDTDRVARIGGEEFLLIMPEQQSQQSAAQAADRLRRLVDEHAWADIDPQLRVTVSAGVATFRAMEMPEQLLARADEALYSAKRHGRNRVCEWVERRGTGPDRERSNHAMKESRR